jgi:cupin superfamily acireductone dioxygenase involved in methionine salvage
MRLVNFLLKQAPHRPKVVRDDKNLSILVEKYVQQHLHNQEEPTRCSPILHASMVFLLTCVLTLNSVN